MGKILIVDDSSAELANLKAIVAEAGHFPVVISDGAQALERAKAEKPDLILMDIVMPGVDGYEACRQVLADPATKGIPVVMVSSKNQKADHLWAKMQGAHSLIGKPYAKADILATIKAVVG
jgi:twitching motility two-component system response regulator PilH